MITGKQVLSLAEVKSIVKKDEEGQQELRDYLKKFTKLSKDKVEKLAEELRKLDNVKIKEQDIVKMVDFLPRDAESLNKIFTEVTLSEEETSVILEIVKRY